MAGWRSFFLLVALIPLLSAQPDPASIAGRRHPRLLVRNAMLVEGTGTPARGPLDVLIEGSRISRIAREMPAESPAVEIDASGKYVLPGFVNLHGHIQDSRGGVPMDVSFCLKLWLAAGITTVRDVGSDFEKARELRALSAEGKIPAPRLFLYPFLGHVRTSKEARGKIEHFRQQGADGVKLLSPPRDVLEAAATGGLPVAIHIGVTDASALDVTAAGSSIEHWYGIPDAALPAGIQNFPPSYNYDNETDRFRWAGRLWREADAERLGNVLQTMVERNVVWDPTLNIYEAARDLQRAQSQPWFRDYLHPALEQFFRPSPTNHGSFFFGWTTGDEVAWKENYRLWMNALVDFERRGGVIGTGEDAGFIYQIQGFGFIRELELHQEAGFHPLKVIQHATHNGARILNRDHEFGRVRAGWLADLIVVNGNPIENLKLLYPGGVTEYKEGAPVAAGGIEWTVKDGIPYHVPTLLAEVRQVVGKARSQRKP